MKNKYNTNLKKLNVMKDLHTSAKLVITECENYIELLSQPQKKGLRYKKCCAVSNIANSLWDIIPSLLRDSLEYKMTLGCIKHLTHAEDADIAGYTAAAIQMTREIRNDVVTIIKLHNNE